MLYKKPPKFLRMNNLIKNIYSMFDASLFRSWILCISFCILILPIAFSQCYSTVGNTLTFTTSGQNTNSNYSTLYLLTDYSGNILASSTTNSFPANNAGLFKIYGLNYLTSAGILNTSVGNNISNISGSCFDISQPFEALICPAPGTTCQTFDGLYSFNSTGGNTAISTVFVLTSLDQTISQISTTPSFSGIPAGDYLIFPVNYMDINGLTIGANFKNISGNCFDVGNPLFIKSCLSCSVSIGEDIDLCQSQSIVLTSSSATSGSYTWSTGQTGNSIMVTPTQSTQTYAVTFTNSEGCTAQDDIIVNILGNPVSNAGADQTICAGQSATLTAQPVPGATYHWSNGATSQSITVSPSASQTYTLTVTKGDCFSVSDVDVTVNILPTVTIAGDNVICNSTSTSLTASGGNIYAWSNGSTTSTITVSPTTTTTYTVTVSDANGCSASESIMVSVSNCDLCTVYNCDIACNECAGDVSFSASSGNPLLTNSFALVDGTGVILQLSTGNTFSNVNSGIYFIFGINYDDTKSFSGLQIGGNIYAVTGDCLDLGQPYVIKVCDNPTPLISGNDQICAGNNTSLSSTGGTSYIWSNGMTASSITVSPTVTTTYTVTITNANGCSTIADTTITVNNCGQIGNFVWQDLNANGIQDLGEPGIEGVHVILLKNGTQVASTFTDPNGMYLFSELAPGDYVLMFEKPSDYTATTANQGTDGANSDANPLTSLTSVYTVSGDYTNLDIDAGYYKLAKLGNFVWEDINKNGSQDANEPGIENVQVILSGTTGSGLSVNLSTYTDQLGMYMFSDLIPGSYTVTFVKPNADYSITTKDANADDARDSDANPTSGVTESIVLTSGEYNQTIDAGMHQCSTVGDYVWLDNGSIPNVQDAGDVGLNGIVVELYSTSNPSTPLQSVLTDINPETNTSGFYQFDVCTPGTYFIKVLKGSTYNFVNPGLSTEDADSDITDAISGVTTTFTVDYGVNISNIDIGLMTIPLPVKLTEFAGSRDKENNENDLYWVTASEINNDFFILERSVNGSPFVEIATIDGAGNSNTSVLYEYTDVDSKQSGTYVYRLIQTDFDGRTEVFGPVTIQVVESADLNVKLYPNPSFNTSFLEINTPVGAKIEGHIFDASGKLIGGQLFDTVVDDGYFTYRLDAQSFAEGVYTIRLIIDGQVKSLRWIVIK